MRNPVSKTEVELLYSTEKEAWILESVLQFEAAHPEVDVITKGMGSLAATRQIIDGKLPWPSSPTCARPWR